MGFRDQITRSALSIPSNIAEGYDRNSRKEYVQFLRIAKGSCGELHTQAHIGKEAGLLSEALAERIMQETNEIGRMLGSMISKLSRQERVSGFSLASRTAPLAPVFLGDRLMVGQQTLTLFI